MESIKLNIALEPNSEALKYLFAKAKELKSSLSDNEIEFVIDNDKYNPHLTMYQTLFPSKNLNLSRIQQLQKY